MKFAQQLEEYRVKAWKDHYIPYDFLKNALKDLSLAQPLSPGRRLSIQRIARGAQENPLSTEAAWYDALEKNAVHAGNFVDKGISDVKEQLADLGKMAEKFHDPTPTRDQNLELGFLEALKRVKEGLSYLKSFAELNHAALFKILKKHDKQLESTDGIKVVFPQILANSKLDDMERFERLDQEIGQLSMLTEKCAGLDVSSASLEVASLAAGLGRSVPVNTSTLLFGTSGKMQGHDDKLLFYFLGAFTAMCLNLAVFIMLPSSEPEKFSMPYFLAPFPVFQVSFALVLTMWAMGFVARTCDSHDINYKFLLKIDPRNRVSPEYFFARAAVLSTCWVLCFGTYVVDYKWQIFPMVNSELGFSERSSLHFFFYPVALLVITIVVLLAPSSVCLCKYRLAVLGCFKRTALAPCYAVTFEDNMFGDVLTSLAKPLIMVPRATCYLISDHPQTRASVSRFEDHGNLCPRWERDFLEPCIAALPFVFRSFQCMRRFYDTRQTKHLWNLAKYLASLSVVVFSSILTKRGLLVVTVSVVATVCSASWDIAVDWGLGLNDLKACARRTRGDLSKSNRLLPARTFWVAAAFDIIARCTWVQTLMPAGLLTSNVVVREAVNASTSAVEIARRSIWAVLRIEYEQVSNASQFRTLLWVPSKLTDAQLPKIFERQLSNGTPSSISPKKRQVSGSSVGSSMAATVIQIREVPNFLERESPREGLLAASQ